MKEPKAGTNDSFSQDKTERFKEPCKECGHRALPKTQSCVMFGDKNNPIKAEINEHLLVGKFKYKIVEGGKLERRSHEPLAELRKVE